MCPRSIVGVPFDSVRRFRASLLLHTTCMHLCRNWVASCVAVYQTKNQKTKNHFVPVFGRPLSSALIHLKHGMKMKLSKSYIRNMQAAFAVPIYLVTILPRKNSDLSVKNGSCGSHFVYV